MRKLIQLSPSTAVVSLPSRWVKKHSLAKGDELSVQELGNQLVISTSKHVTTSAVTVDVRALPDKLVWTACDAAYIAGHDEITFVYTAHQASTLEFVKNEVPGMLVTRQQGNSLTLKDITAGKSEDVHSIITRILHMISDLLDQAVSAAKRKEWASLAKMKERDYAINSYISYAQRQINKFGFEKTYSSNLIVTLLKLCEMFADQACGLCTRSAESKQDQARVLEQTLITWRETVLLFLGYTEARLIASESARTRIPKVKGDENGAQLANTLFDILEVIVQIQSSRT